MPQSLFLTRATPDRCGGTCVDTQFGAARCSGRGRACPSVANGTSCDFACKTGYMKSGSTCVAALPGTCSALPSLPTPRRLLAAATGVDGRIYAIGGTNAASMVTGVAEVFDPKTNS